jgi:hypothetical protein
MSKYTHFINLKHLIFLDGGSTSQLQLVICKSMYVNIVSKLSYGMYNAREDMHFLSPPHHLEKASDMTYTMHYLLLSSLTINVK